MWRERAILQKLTAVVIDEAELRQRAVEFLYQMQQGEQSLHDCETSFPPLSLSQGETLAAAAR